MTPAQRIEYIQLRLTEVFHPVTLEIQDDSHRHAGHASAGGGGHFNVRIVSEAFAGNSLIKRHRMVYDALKDAMQANEIHALSIKAHTPSETTVES